jgi:xanthine dehydrogenase accessory factor
MMSREDVLIEAGRLSAQSKPYVLATVVRVERPASTRRGDRAIVTPEGALAGWVGGACSEPTVIREALRALEAGEPRLVRIVPRASSSEAGGDVMLAESTCASEGTVEVLIEPSLPAPILSVIGESPVALTLVELARTIGWKVSTEVSAAADAVVVATMGHGDEGVLEAALAGSAGYIGLVASSRRAAVVLGALRERGLGEEALARIRSPAGLDLGSSRQEEIAVAILAELVAWRHARPRPEHILAEAVDPVCGMTVSVAGARERTTHKSVTYYFCNPGCRERFEADPVGHLESASR